MWLHRDWRILVDLLYGGIPLKNYSTAKRVQAFSSKGDFEKAKKLMIEMSENYKVLIDLFPENTQEGFDTEALLTIWDEKDNKLYYNSGANFVWGKPIKVSKNSRESLKLKKDLEKLMNKLTIEANKNF